MMMTTTEYYATLGVSEQATLDEIKRAYRALALQHHPDRQPPERRQAAEERFKEIAEAYYVLSDPQRRQEYDIARRGGAVQGLEGFNVEEFMRYVRGGRTARSSGFGVFDDILGDLFVGSSSPRQGAHRTVIFSDGTGHPRMVEETETRTTQTDLEAVAEVSTRAVQQGAKVRLRPPGGNTLVVDVPRNAQSGQRLRLKGQGRACPCCGKAGDLYVRIKVT